MKQFINTIYTPQFQKVICLMIAMLTITCILHAQIGDPGGGGSGDPDDAPIDGGLSLLIAAGVGYGTRKLRNKQKAGIK